MEPTSNVECQHNYSFIPNSIEETALSNLPKELIRHIFSILTLPDLPKASLANKSWNIVVVDYVKNEENLAFKLLVNWFTTHPEDRYSDQKTALQSLFNETRMSDAVTLTQVEGLSHALIDKMADILVDIDKVVLTLAEKTLKLGLSSFFIARIFNLVTTYKKIKKADSISNPLDKSTKLATSARNLTLYSHIDKAIDTANKIPFIGKKIETFNFIMCKPPRNNDLINKFIRVCDNILKALEMNRAPGDDIEHWVLPYFSRSLANLSQYETAFKVARKIVWNSSKNETFRSITLEMAKQGLFEEACNLAHQMDHEKIKISTIESIKEIRAGHS